MTLAAVLLVALAARVVFARLVIAQHSATSFVEIHGDTAGYLLLGERLYDGRPYTSSDTTSRNRGLIRPPGYPAFYVAVRAVYETIGVNVRHNLRPIVWPQVLLSLVQVAATYALALLALRRVDAAAAAGLIAALSPTGIATAAIAMPDSPFAACFAAAFCVFVAATQRQPAAWITSIAGASLALAALLKPAGIYWPALAIPALLLTRGWNRATWADLRRLLLPLAIVVVTWTGFNYGSQRVPTYSTVSARNLRYDVVPKVELTARLGRLPTQAEYIAYTTPVTQRDTDFLLTEHGTPAALYRQMTAETRAVLLAHPWQTVRVLSSNLKSQLTSRYKRIQRQLPAGRHPLAHRLRVWVDATDTPAPLIAWYGAMLLAVPLWLSDRRTLRVLLLCWIGFAFIALPTASVANEGSRLVLAGEPMAATLIVACAWGLGGRASLLVRRVRQRP